MSEFDGGAEDAADVFGDRGGRSLIGELCHLLGLPQSSWRALYAA